MIHMAKLCSKFGEGKSMCDGTVLLAEARKIPGHVTVIL